MTILQDLFYGNLAPFTGNFESRAEYAEAVRTVMTHEEKLMDLLEGTERELFREFSNACSTMNGIMAEEEFIVGFKMGALMMIEVFGGRGGRPIGE